MPNNFVTRKVIID